jgi:hypothetical protein
VGIRVVAETQPGHRALAASWAVVISLAPGVRLWNALFGPGHRALAASWAVVISLAPDVRLWNALFGPGHRARPGAAF